MWTLLNISWEKVSGDFRRYRKFFYYGISGRRRKGGNVPDLEKKLYRRCGKGDNKAGRYTKEIAAKGGIRKGALT